MAFTTSLAIGQDAPDFNLRGPGGQRITLSEYKGQKHVILAFYPLAFSPACSHQLPTIQADVARLEQLGAIVLGISVDSHWSNSAFARELGLSFPLLSDWDRNASEAYGVLLSPSGYSCRALFVVDKQGRLVHQTILEDIEEIPDLEKAIDALKTLA